MIRVEHRLTTRLGPYVVRYWIESDPSRGGVESTEQARTEVEKVEARAKSVEEKGEAISARTLAEFLSDLCMAANAVEVCNTIGVGVIVRRERGA